MKKTFLKKDFSVENTDYGFEFIEIWGVSLLDKLCYLIFLILFCSYDIRRKNSIGDSVR